MIKVREIEGNGIYLLEGLSTANTHFIENKTEVQIFLNLVEKRLGRYMKILEYVIRPTGWQLLVQTKSELVIRSCYENQRNIRRKKPEARELTTVRLIIGEAIRILRSRFTNITNPLRGREGNASKRVFRKYLFDNVEEARVYISKMRNQEVELEQSNERYKANTDHYDEDEQLKLDAEILSSKKNQESSCKGSLVFHRCIKLYDILGSAFRELIETTNARYQQKEKEVRSEIRVL